MDRGRRRATIPDRVPSCTPIACLLLLWLAQAPQSAPASRPVAAALRTLVLPRANATQAGTQNNNIPFSWRPVRYQQCVAPEQFAFDGTLNLSGVALRLAAGHEDTTNSGDVDLEIALACGPRHFDELSNRFADNLVRDRVVVVPRRMVAIGRAAERAKGTPDTTVWDVHVPFRQPYAFKTDSVLVFEVRVFGNSHGDQLFTFPLDAVTVPGIKRLSGDLDAEQAQPGELGLVLRFDVASCHGTDLLAAAPAASRPTSQAVR